MALTLHPPPSHIQKLAKAAIADMQNRGFVPRNYAREAEIDLARPYPVYMSALSSFRDGSFIQKATLVRWAFIILEDNQPAGTVEIAGDAVPEAIDAYTAKKAGHANALVRCIAAAEAFCSKDRSRYDVRILRIPAIYFTAIWLHHPRHDHFFPTESSRLPGSVPYSPERLRQALDQRARLRAATDDSEK